MLYYKGGITTKLELRNKMPLWKQQREFIFLKLRHYGSGKEVQLIFESRPYGSGKDIPDFSIIDSVE